MASARADLAEAGGGRREVTVFQAMIPKMRKPPELAEGVHVGCDFNVDMNWWS